MTMELYTFGTSNGKRASVMLEEVGVDYVAHKVDILAGAHKQEDFLKLNPNAQIPVLVDPDGPGGARLVLDQSIAIMMYLPEKTGKFLPSADGGRPAFWRALTSATADIGMTVGAILAISRMAEPHKPTQDMFEARLGEYLGVWDETFRTQTYAAGEEVTVADLALYPVLARLGDVMPRLTEGYANLDRWAAEIGARPGVSRGMSIPS